MSLLVLGVSHKTAPVDQREKVALSESEARALLADLAALPEVDEAVALSTCNRTEIYLAGDDPSGIERAATRAIVRHSRMSDDEFSCVRYLLHDDEASQHLFRVAASLDSMVLGESEIQAQVRDAWQRSMAVGASGARLNRLFRAALEVGKRVRSETRIGKGAVSVSSVAVDLATQTLGDLGSSSVLVLGAGQMAEATTRALVAQGATAVVVANRTEGTARSLAGRVGGRGVDLAHVGPELEMADIVISSTDAPHPILTRDDLERAVDRRLARPMLLIDISVPRDLDPGVASLPGVTLHDIDALERVVESNLNGRRVEAERGEMIVADAVHEFAEWRAKLAISPTIRSLRDQAERIRTAELERVRARLDAMSEQDRELVETVSKGIINTLLHDPTVRVQDAVREAHGQQHVESLRYLFDLDDER